MNKVNWMIGCLLIFGLWLATSAIAIGGVCIGQIELNSSECYFGLNLPQAIVSLVIGIATFVIIIVVVRKLDSGIGDETPMYYV